jgi:hypothetical protein
MQRCRKLLDGLPDHLKDKAIEHCAGKQWRLSSKETDGGEPKFDELVTFIKGKANAEKKKAVYEQERAMEIPIGTASMTAATMTSATSASIVTPPPLVAIVPATPDSAQPTIPASTITPSSTKSVPDPVDSLAEQFSKLTLALQASITNALAPLTNSQSANKPPSASGFESTNRRGPAENRPPRCLWCDSEGHMRNNCAEFHSAFKEGKVRLNERNRIIDGNTGQEVPVFFGRGGMKVLYRTAQAQPSPIVNNITVEAEYASIGGDNTVTVSTIDFETDTCVTEVIDAEVYEKRKKAEGHPLAPRKRQAHGLGNNGGEAPMEEIMDLDSGSPGLSATQNRQSDSSPTPNPPASTVPNAPNTSNAPKYRLASKLSETISVGDVGEKIMDSSILLSLREALAVSSDLSNYLHQQTKKHRYPLNVSEQANPTSANATNVSVNHNSLYACASSRAKAVLDGTLTRWALLDHGSEVNLMPLRTYEKLNYPIDDGVKWTINGFEGENSSTGRILGVCHDLRVSVGGVEVKTPVFVVERSGQDLLLGRPWEREVRAGFINEDDGSVSVQIKSPDGRRVVSFKGVNADHERNRKHARFSEDERHGEEDPLKM